MDIDIFIEICSQLNLGKLLDKPTRIFGGLLNKLYKIKTTNGYFAVKQLLHKDIDKPQILHRYELSEQIAAKFKELNIPTIEALKHHNKYILYVNNDYFIVYPWVEASSIDEATSKPHVLKMAKLLAQIHSIKLDISDVAANISYYHENEEIIELIDKTLIVKLKEFKNMILKLNQSYIDFLPLLKTTTQITHCDLDYKNILWNKALMPKIIDWESAGKLSTAQEFINMSIDWNGRRANMDLSLFKETIKTYINHGGKLDYESFKAGLAGTFGNYINWMIYNLKRILHPTSEEEKNMGIDEVNKLLISFTHLFPKIDELRELYIMT